MYSWSFSNHKDRTPLWYIVGAILVLSLVIYGIIAQVYLMSIVAVLFSGTYILIENNSSDVTEVKIDEKKLQVNETIYYWENFESFSIIEANGAPLFLRLYPKKKIGTTIDVPFTEKVHIEEVRSLLLSVLEENENTQIGKMDTLIYLSKL